MAMIVKKKYSRISNKKFKNILRICRPQGHYVSCFNVMIDLMFGYFFSIGNE